jgi:O-antigen ligase
VVLLAALVVALVAVGTHRAAAVPLAAVAAGCAVLLVRRSRDEREPSEATLLASLGEWALALAPGAAVVYFSFNGGGYFPGSQAFVATLLALALALRLALASEPLAGFSRPLVVAAIALALYALWTLLSASWSHAPGRALVEFDRALLYLLALVLFASVPWGEGRLRRMVRGLAAGATLVCAVALVTRVAPDAWPIAPGIQRGRLSYPLTYWNALGLLAALALILLAYLTTSEREPRLVRVLAAAATPVVATTLLFTFSRGGIAVAIIGVVAYLAMARPRGLVGGALAAGAGSAVALLVAYGADRLASRAPATPAATAQGHHVALVVAFAIAGAAVARALFLPLDARLATLRLPPHVRRPVTIACWTAIATAGLALFLAAGGPTALSRQYHRFVNGNDVRLSGDLRSRLTDPGNNKRIEQWHVAMNGFARDRFGGYGAGTYQELWLAQRRERFYIRDAHSLYAEVLGELGIVGLALLTVGLAALGHGVFKRTRRRHRRYIGAALLAAGLAWALRAAFDWDWEMPAVTLWLFALGGAAAARREGASGRPLAPSWRAGLSLACVALALVPAALAVSQNRLEAAQTALARGDCATALAEADASARVLGFRAEPHAIAASCHQRAGHSAAALREIREAIRLDPHNWEYRSGLARILAAAGGDSARPARAARAMNPLAPVTSALATR